jgi:uncharacterized Tic20 family protein
MTDSPGESPEPRPTASTPTTPPADAPSLLDLPEPPPAPPAPPPDVPSAGRAVPWSEPPTQVPPPGSTGWGPPPPPRTAPYPASAPGAPLGPAQERTWAMLAHFSALAALVVGMNFLGPLITYLALRDRSEFVRDQAAESLNFQITVLIAGFVSILCIPLLGLGVLMLLVVFIGWLILTVIAGIAANNGQRFRYPVNLRLVR